LQLVTFQFFVVASPHRRRRRKFSDCAPGCSQRRHSWRIDDCTQSVRDNYNL